MTDRDSRVEQLYREQGLRMWRALVGYSSDPEVASDAVAEAFARAVRDEAGIRDLAAWTWRVAFRLATAELRQRNDLASGHPITTTSEMPDQVPEIVAALRQLSPNQRLAIVMHDYADRPSVVGLVCGKRRILECYGIGTHGSGDQSRRRCTRPPRDPLGASRTRRDEGRRP